MKKIRDLETPKIMAPVKDDIVYDIPTFTQHLNDLDVEEKGTAIFECKVEPTTDPAMKIGILLKFFDTMNETKCFHIQNIQSE